MSDIAGVGDSLDSLSSRLDAERRRESEMHSRTAAVELAIRALTGIETTDDGIVAVAKTFADFIITGDLPSPTRVTS